MPEKTPPADNFHRFMTDRHAVYLRGPADIIIRQGQGVVVIGDETFQLRDEPDSAPGSAYAHAVAVLGGKLTKVLDEPEVLANVKTLRVVKLKAGFPYLHLNGQDFKVHGRNENGQQLTLEDILDRLADG